MSDKLQEICAKKRQQVKQEKEVVPLKTMVNEAHKSLSTNPPRGFERALDLKHGQGQPALICEIKKASPSAGLIREDFNPAQLAMAYKAGGAACLSVLTDMPYFQGKKDYLIKARAACNIPVLRKDFMLDIYQVAEARALGADCILLIMAALTDEEALELHATATHYNMDVLIETHTKQEIERALKLPSGMIGINNRNLKTLQIDLNTTIELQKLVPQDRKIICESGIKTPEDIALMSSHNIRNFLIGETLMKQEDVTSATREMMETYSHLK